MKALNDRNTLLTICQDMKGAKIATVRFDINFKELYGKVIAKHTIKIDEEILVYYGPNFNYPKGEVINHEDSPR